MTKGNETRDRILETAFRLAARDGLEAMRIAEAASRSLVEVRKVALQEIVTGGEKEVSPELMSR